MPELLDELGIGTIHAATLLAETGDPRCFRSQHSFAMYAGCAPIERSSGSQHRRQLNTGGNRIFESNLSYDYSSSVSLSSGFSSLISLKKLKKVKPLALPCVVSKLPSLGMSFVSCSLMLKTIPKGGFLT